MKKVISVIITLGFLLFMVIPAYAHNKDQHNEELEYVMFRDRHYADSHPLTGSIIKRIEDASYLAIDQFNGDGKEALDRLIADKIPGIPSSIKEINFTSSSFHRYHTHRGWNLTYDEKAHWAIRQSILKNTIRVKLFGKVETLFSRLPWVSNQVYGERSYERKSEAFAVLVYYVHILGDHIEAEKYTNLAYLAPLANFHERDNPGIIPDLIRYVPILFAEQQESEQYKSMIQDLEQLAERSDKLYNAVGGVREEQFFEYHQCANDLLEILATYIPDLLRKEEFFHKTFFE